MHINLKGFVDRLVCLVRGDSPRRREKRPETPLWGTPFPRSYYEIDPRELQAGLRRQGAMIWGDHGPGTSRDLRPEALPASSRRANPADPKSPLLPRRSSSLTYASFPLPPPPEPIAYPPPVHEAQGRQALRPLRLPALILQRAEASRHLAEDDSDDEPLWSAHSDPFDLDDIEMQPMLSVRDRPPTPFMATARRATPEPFNVRLEAAVLRAVRPLGRHDAPWGAASPLPTPNEYEELQPPGRPFADEELRFSASEILGASPASTPQPQPGTPDSDPGGRQRGR